MRECVIREDDQESKDKINKALEAGYWFLAGVSNCGVEKGCIRLTFLPMEAKAKEKPCLFENISEEELSKPMGISCQCKKCTPWSL